MLVDNYFEGERLQEINQQLNAAVTARNLRGQLTMFDQSTLNGTVWIGSFKSLDDDLLVEAIRSVPWGDPHSLQLFFNHQDDGGFSEREGFRQWLMTHERRLVAEKGLHLVGPSEQVAFHESLPAMIKEKQEDIDRVERNPLRQYGGPWQATETDTRQSWVFEILRIGKEGHGSSRVTVPAPDGDKTKETSTMVPYNWFGIGVAYRGWPGYVDCTSSDMGAEAYGLTKSAMQAADVGDTIEFKGHVSVDYNGRWTLTPSSPLVRRGA